MKSIVCFVLVAFSLNLNAQLEKPKPAQSPSTTAPKSAAVQQASVEINWTGQGAVNVRIGPGSFVVKPGVATTAKVQAGVLFAITVTKPGKEYTSEEFMVFEPGQTHLYLEVVAEKLQVKSVTQAEIDERPYVLRHEFYPWTAQVIVLHTYSFKTNELVAFQNGLVITSDEFLNVFSKNKDTARDSKAEYLELYITFKQKVLEGQEQNIDTSSSFKKEIDGYREQLLKPYLNKGWSRESALAQPSFHLLLKEYYDGVLLFTLMDKEVWTLAVKDVTGLERFYNLNAAQYNNQSLGSIKPQVTTDYQNELELQLVQKLKAKFPCKINYELLNRL